MCRHTPQTGRARRRTGRYPHAPRPAPSRGYSRTSQGDPPPPCVALLVPPTHAPEGPVVLRRPPQLPLQGRRPPRGVVVAVRAGPLRVALQGEHGHRYTLRRNAFKANPHRGEPRHGGHHGQAGQALAGKWDCGDPSKGSRTQRARRCNVAKNARARQGNGEQTHSHTHAPPTPQAARFRTRPSPHTMTHPWVPDFDHAQTTSRLPHVQQRVRVALHQAAATEREKRNGNAIGTRS